MEFANTWPDWGPGPHPSMFVWIPFAIAGFGVVMLCVQLVNLVRAHRESESTQSYPMRSSPYDSLSSSSTQISGYRETITSYRTPPFCSQCGAALDPEQVEWIGPLRFTCPSCGRIGTAEETQF
jgi:predicted RNA-binding Zn-ribbon protein involved in translation (DUF1610 family)